MGTVGLSFGSPTSGTGFDVSSTVASIVSNLQNVETPWKTQLAALQSQDTVISSLGTLFSNLSNDMSSLTDFQGILSEKTGSSSDTNVLTLTAADSTAIAGTHTVEVTSLATTSSGYLAPITSASAALTGSITLQVGSGTTETVVIGAAPSTPAANTVYTGTGVNTLSGLAAAINTSGVGINASVLTDSSGSRLSLVSDTSGAKGGITVSGNSIAAPLNYTAAGNDSSSGTVGLFANAATDALSGSISIKVGSGTTTNVVIGAAPSSPAANTTYTGSGADTLADLESAIAGAGQGVTATIVNNSDGSSSLSLSSGSAGALAVSSNVVDTSAPLAYTSPVGGADAVLTVDGAKGLTSASNTVANLIPGVTFQLLAPSATGEQVQVVIGNDNTDVESTINKMVTDYNSLVSAMSAQEGTDSSGNAEPLFGSPTLSLLQQQLLGSLNTQNPNGCLDPIKNASDVLSGSITIQMAGGIPLYYTGNASTGSQNSSGTLAPITNAGDTLSGSISIQVGNGTAQTIQIGASSTPATLAGLADAINSASIGVTASIVANNDGSSSLSLLSGTSGDAEALTVTSSIADKSTQTIGVPTTSGNNTLAGMASAINAAHSGVTANVVTNSSGSQLELVSGTAGPSGTLTVASSITDTATNATLNYSNGATDINSLTSLGISVNNDGSLTLDAQSLDSVLNSDYGSVVGFFQNSNSWGQTFSTMLTNAGTSAPTDILTLAATSNSNIESTLNADISKEASLISTQQKSLTTELNSANEIMQQLPSQLDGINELYAAITGYSQTSGG